MGARLPRPFSRLGVFLTEGVGPVNLGLRGTAGGGRGGSLSQLHMPVPVGTLESEAGRVRPCSRSISWRSRRAGASTRRETLGWKIAANGESRLVGGGRHAVSWGESGAGGPCMGESPNSMDGP